MFSLRDVLAPELVGKVLHDATPLQQMFMLFQDEVLSKPDRRAWADHWMFRDIDNPDVVYSFNKANLKDGAEQFQAGVLY